MSNGAIADAAGGVLEAARAVERDAGPADAGELPRDLQALASALDAAGRAFVPAVAPQESMTRRQASDSVRAATGVRAEQP